MTVHFGLHDSFRNLHRWGLRFHLDPLRLRLSARSGLNLSLDFRKFVCHHEANAFGRADCRRDAADGSNVTFIHWVRLWFRRRRRLDWRRAQEPLLNITDTRNW